MSIYSLPPILVALACLDLGLFVFTRDTRSPVYRAYFLFTLSLASWLFSYGLAYSLEQETAASFLLRIGYSGVIFIPVTTLHVGLRLLGHLKVGSLTRWLLPTCVLVGVVFVGLLWGSPYLISGIHRYFWGFYPIAGIAHPVYLAFFCAAFSVTFILLCWGKRRLRHEDGSQQDQTQIRLFQTALLIGVIGSVDFLANYRLPLYPFGYIFVCLMVCLSVYAIIRHHFLDIRVVIKASLVYSILIACITAMYLMVVLVVERGFQGFFGYRSIFATAVVAFLIAVFFDPLRNRIQMVVDRALFKATPAELAEQREQLLAEIRKTEQIKAVATLAAGLAHEIKNPLTSIKIFTE